MSQRGISKTREQRLRQGGLFVPLVFAFAARLEGLPAAEFLDSPTKVVNGLRSVFGHFGADGVACWCDDTALAAALGCALDWSTYPPGVAAPPPPPETAVPGTASGGGPGGPTDPGDTTCRGPAAVAADVVRRLGQLMPDTVLVGTMPGPALLAAQVAGAPPEEAAASEEVRAPTGSNGPRTAAGPEELRAAAKTCLSYAKSLCDAGLDVLLIREERLPGAGREAGAPPGAGGAAAAAVGLTPGDVARLYSPIWNTTRHYGVAALLAPSVVDVADLASLASAVDGVVVPVDAAAAEAAQVRARFKRVGIGLPADLLGRPAPEIAAYLDEHDLAGLVRGGAFLVTTAGEVPLEVDREALIAGVGIIRDRIKEAIPRD